MSCTLKVHDTSTNDSSVHFTSELQIILHPSWTKYSAFSPQTWKRKSAMKKVFAHTITFFFNLRETIHFSWISQSNLQRTQKTSRQTEFGWKLLHPVMTMWNVPVKSLWSHILTNPFQSRNIWHLCLLFGWRYGMATSKSASYCTPKNDRIALRCTVIQRKRKTQR